MFPILPWELVSAIIQHVIERSTLITLCLTTKAAYSEASKRIYRDLSDNLDRNPAHHLHRIKALIAYPRLASLVRSFSIKSVASSWRYTPPNNGLETEDEALVKKGRKVDLKGEIWGILPQALNLMSNLEHLSFREFSGQPSAHWLLPNVTFQLKTLRWGSHGEGEPMAAFLETQQRLETLHLEEGLSCPMDPGSCLTLKSVQGNLSTFQRFLPGRPGIKHLRWVPSMEEYDGDPLINILVEELGRITHFSIGGYFMRRLLSVFGGHFRDLIALEIYYIYEPEIPVVFAIPKLQVLVISSPVTGGVVGDPDSVSRRLFEGTPPLRSVFTSLVAHQTKGVWQKRYQWWKRSQMATPIVVRWTKCWLKISDFCPRGPFEEIPPGWTVEATKDVVAQLNKDYDDR